MVRDQFPVTLMEQTRKSLRPLMMRGLAAALFLSALSLSPSADDPIFKAAAISKPIKASHVQNELLVRFRAGVGPSEAASALSRRGMTILNKYRKVANLYHVLLPAGLSVESAVETLKTEPSVQYAEANYTIEFDSACSSPCSPNDTDYTSIDNWGMVNIGAPEAWTVTTGDSSVVVAILDSGIDYTHPDLAANAWTNPGETPGDGIDDDGNGYVDDVYGYNAVADIGAAGTTCSSPASSDPIDDDTSVHGHGTRLAGIIGAVGNNGIGIAGVNWNVKLMPIKIRCEPNRQSSLDLLLAGFDYLIEMRNRGVNVRAANMSVSVSSWSQSLQDGFDAVRDAGVLLVGSAGSDPAVTGFDVDADSTDFHRAYDNVLFVGSTNDPSNNLAVDSNYGQIGVQLAAPGMGILSTIRSSYDPLLYEPDNGTSYAAPFVTGVAALLAAFDPSLTYSQLKARIVSATTRSAALSGKVSSGGRLNAAGVFTAPITDLTPAGYQLARIEAGHKFYLDRTFTVAGIPQGFDGLWWVRTRNDDKVNAGDDYIRLGLGQPATMYVAFDGNATQVPDWLGPDQDWTDTGRTVSTSVGSISLKIYTRPFNPGNVMLGGAVAAGYVGPEPGQNTNYVVLIRSATGDADRTAPSTDRLDGYDLVAFNLAMGSSEGLPNWCASCDLDGSGTIDATDLGLFMDNFGKSL